MLNQYNRTKLDFMKPILFHNPKAIEESFYVQEDKVPHFYDLLHFHPEYQFTVIVKGSGTVFLGDHIGRFESGDVFIIGPSIPHVFRCDHEYYEGNTEKTAHGISMYFMENSLGDNFFNLPENKPINSLLKLAARGVQIKPVDTEEIKQLMLLLKRMKGPLRLTTFLEILCSFEQADKKALSSIGYIGSAKEEGNDRMNLVFKYIMDNFRGELNLEKAADLSCMTTTAFCRFFKKKTRKTFFEVVAETRIGYSCKLLLKESYSINEIAFSCGYNNISNFNRQFRRIMKITPSLYVEKYGQKGD